MVPPQAWLRATLLSWLAKNSYPTGSRATVYVATLRVAADRQSSNEMKLIQRSWGFGLERWTRIRTCRWRFISWLARRHHGSTSAIRSRRMHRAFLLASGTNHQLQRNRSSRLHPLSRAGELGRWVYERYPCCLSPRALRSCACRRMRTIRTTGSARWRDVATRLAGDVTQPDTARRSLEYSQRASRKANAAVRLVPPRHATACGCRGRGGMAARLRAGCGDGLHVVARAGGCMDRRESVTIRRG